MKRIGLEDRVERMKQAVAAVVVISLLIIATPAGQKKPSRRRFTPTLSDRVAKAKAELNAAANDYKVSLGTLLMLQENDVNKASEAVARDKQLFAQGKIDEMQLNETQRALANAKAKVADTKKKLSEADALIEEATAEELLVKAAPRPVAKPINSALKRRLKMADASEEMSELATELADAITDSPLVSSSPSSQEFVDSLVSIAETQKKVAKTFRENPTQKFPVSNWQGLKGIGNSCIRRLLNIAVLPVCPTDIRDSLLANVAAIKRFLSLVDEEIAELKGRK
jgi:hypothetical protein